MGTEEEWFMLQQNTLTETIHLYKAKRSFAYRLHLRTSSLVKQSLVLFWSRPFLQISVINIFSSFDGFASLTLIFLVFFFVEKKRFCGTMFLLCGTCFGDSEGFSCHGLGWI